MAKVLPLCFTAKLVLVQHLLDRSELTNPHVARLLLQTLAAEDYGKVSEAILQLTVTMYPRAITDELILGLSVEGMKSLNLKGCAKVSHFAVRTLLEQCPNLHVLTLMDCPQMMLPSLFHVSEGTWAPLSSVSLENCETVTDLTVQTLIRNFPTLRHLNVSWCLNLTDDVFLLNKDLQLKRDTLSKSLRDQLPPYEYSLTSVDLSGCRLVTSRGVRHLVTLCGPSLLSVNISYTGADCVSLLYLSGYSLATSLNFATEHGLSVSGHKRLTAFRAESKVELEKLERLWQRYEQLQGDPSSSLLDQQASDEESESSSLGEEVALDILPPLEDLSAPVMEGAPASPLMPGTSESSLTADQSDAGANPYAVSSSVAALADAIAGNLCTLATSSLVASEMTDTAVALEDVALKGLEACSDSSSPVAGPSRHGEVQPGETGSKQVETSSGRTPGKDGSLEPKGPVGKTKGKKRFLPLSPGADSSSENSLEEEVVTTVKKDRGIVIRRADIMKLLLDSEWKESDSEDASPDDHVCRRGSPSLTSNERTSSGEGTPSLPGSRSSLTKRRSAISPHGERRSSKKSDLHVSFVNVPPDDEEDMDSRKSGYGSDSSSDHSGSFTREFDRENVPSTSRPQAGSPSDQSEDPSHSDVSGARSGILRNPAGSSSAGHCKSMRNRSSSLPSALPSASLVSSLRSHKKRSVSFALGTETQRSRTLPNVSLAYFDQESLSAQQRKPLSLSPRQMRPFTRFGFTESVDDFPRENTYQSGARSEDSSRTLPDAQPSTSRQTERGAEEGVDDGNRDSEQSSSSVTSSCTSDGSPALSVQQLPGETNQGLSPSIDPADAQSQSSSRHHPGAGFCDRNADSLPDPSTPDGGSSLSSHSSHSGDTPLAAEDEAQGVWRERHVDLSTAQVAPKAVSAPSPISHLCRPPIFQSLGGTDLRASPGMPIPQSRGLARSTGGSNSPDILSSPESSSTSELLLNLVQISSPTASTSQFQETSHGSTGVDHAVPVVPGAVGTSAPGESEVPDSVLEGMERRPLVEENSSFIAGDNVLIRSRATPNFNSPVVEEEASTALQSSSDESSDQLPEPPLDSCEENARSTQHTAMGDNCQLYQPQIISLDVSAMDFFDQAFGLSCLRAFVSANPRLQKLSVSWKFFSDTMLNLIGAHLPDLREISLRECDHLSSNALSRLGHDCPKLEKVDLQGICFISDSAVVPLLHNKGLRWLSLSECEVTEATMRRIAHHTKASMKELDLCWCEEISEEGINAVAASCSHLTRLNLRQCNASNLSVRLIAENCCQLQTLVLSCIKSFNDAAAVLLAERLTLLEDLDISWNSDISDEGIGAILRHCSRLKSAIFSGIKRMSSKPLLPIIADLEQFRRCQALIRFKFEECHVLVPSPMLQDTSDEECENVSMPHRSTIYAPVLQDLDLAYCDKVDDTHLAEIVAVCRGSLKITDYYGGEVAPVLVPHQNGPLLRTRSS